MKVQNSNITGILINLAYMNGGGTIAKKGNLPKKGYLVGVKNIYEGPFPEHSGMKAIQFKIELSSNRLFGSWKLEVKDAPDVLYIDEVKVYYDFAKALEVAREKGELAIWDISNEVEIKLKEN